MPVPAQDGYHRLLLPFGRKDYHVTNPDEDDIGKLLNSMMGALETRMMGNINDQVQQGVKRFALALKQIDPKIKHSTAIEIIARALAFKDWRELYASLAEMSGDTTTHLSRIKPVLDCPLPPYEPPCPPMVNHLLEMAERIGTEMNVETTEVLDKVIAFAHNAASWDDLLSRDPYSAGDLFETAKDDDGDTFLVLSEVGKAAFHAIRHTIKDLEETSPLDQSAILLELLGRNPQLFPAWKRLFDLGQVEEENLIAIDMCLAAMMDVFERNDCFLDEDVDGVDDLCNLAGALAPVLLSIGAPEAAFKLASHVFFNQDGDHLNLRFSLAIAATSPDVEEAPFDISEILFGELKEGITINDPNSLLCSGLLMLDHFYYSVEEAMNLILRADFITEGALRRALAADEDGPLPEADIYIDRLRPTTQLLVMGIHKCLPDFCMRFSSAVKLASLSKADREIARYRDRVLEMAPETFAHTNAQARWIGETISRANALSPKVAKAYLQAL